MLAVNLNKTFATLALATVAALSAQSATAAQSAPFLDYTVSANRFPAPDISGNGQWKILPNGCSYSRAKAPGYPAQWILILNPHHIGGKYVVPSMNCKSSMRAS